MDMPWLILRRDGCLWGIPGADARVIRDDKGVRVLLGDSCVHGEEILTLDRHLQVRPAGPVVRSMIPRGCSGLALSEHGPLLVVDPARPPEALAENLAFS